jgi:hypothetical protein
MEFFLPSILVLLVAAAIVFFVIPRFGPLVLAVVSLVLLGIGIYNHYSMFQNEYRLSTWQLGAVAYAPYILIGAVILMIILYLTYLLPSGSSANNSGTNNGNVKANANVKPNTINLPPPETATNVITEGANNAIRAAAKMANVKVNTTNQPNNPANLGLFGNLNNNNNNNNIFNNNPRPPANRNPYSPPFL